MLANKKLLGIFVLAAAAVGTMAASPAQAGNYDRRDRGRVVYREAAPRASVSIRIDSGHHRHHYVKRDRCYDRRDFRDHRRNWRHVDRRDFRRGRC
jgi:hypothetical protein